MIFGIEFVRSLPCKSNTPFTIFFNLVIQDISRKIFSRHYNWFDYRVFELFEKNEIVVFFSVRRNICITYLRRNICISYLRELTYCLFRVWKRTMQISFLTFIIGELISLSIWALSLLLVAFIMGKVNLNLWYINKKLNGWDCLLATHWWLFVFKDFTKNLTPHDKV